LYVDGSEEHQSIENKDVGGLNLMSLVGKVEELVYYLG